MIKRRFTSNIAALSGVGADVMAWQAAVVANGGTVSAARLAIVNTFVLAEKAAGAWDLTDDYWGLWGEDAAALGPQSLTSLKQRRLATAVNGPVGTNSRGIVFDGLTNYLTTGFIPSANGVAMTGSEQRVAVYSRTNVSGTGVALGTLDATTRNASILPRSTGNMQGRLNTSGTSFALGLADARGYKAVSRTGGGTTMLAYDRGVRLTDATGLTVANVIPTREFYVGALNNAGTAGSFLALSGGFCAVGASLSDAQELAQYNNVQAWATSIGANV